MKLYCCNSYPLANVRMAKHNVCIHKLRNVTTLCQITTNNSVWRGITILQQHINPQACGHTILLKPTVPIFNSCTKCVGSPVIKNDQTSDFHPVSWSWVRPRVTDLKTERSFDSPDTWVVGLLGLLWTCYSWVSVQRGTGRRPVDWWRN